MLMPGVHALTLEEKMLTSIGFTGLTLSTANQTQCVLLSFSPFADSEKKGNDTLLSFTWDLLPLSEMDSNIFVRDKITNEPIRVLTPNDRTSTGRIHMEIPHANVHSPTTALELCGATSASGEWLHVSEEGTIGLYQQPKFDGPTHFQTIIAGKNPLLGQEIPIQVSLTNTGSQPADVRIDYRKYDLPYIPLLKGQTGFEGTIEPGEQKIITYLIKPLRAVQILLPPAVLTYTDIFGETVTQESTRAYLEVAAPEFNVKGAFFVPQTQVRVNEPVNVRWVAKNEGLTPIDGLRVAFTVKPNGVISPSTIEATHLTPSEAQSRDFTITFEKAGTYELGCLLTSAADPALKTDCESAAIEVVENDTLLPLAFSVLLLLIAMGVYAYISLAPNKIAEPPKPKRGRFHSDF